MIRAGIGARTGAAAIVVAALCIRIPDIFRRPFHTDEAVNAFILGDLLSGRGYAYRPEDHHGPALYWLAALPAKLAGVTDVAGMTAPALRSLTVLLGAATVAAMFRLWRRFAGDAAIFAAAAFVALAAPFAYVSGTFIHESLLLLLAVPFFAALWHWRETAAARSAAVAGLFAGLMLATKETAVPICGAALLACLPGKPMSARKAAAGLALAALVATAVVVVFFSDFLRHPGRLADILEATKLQTRRGLGDEHAHPWYTFAMWAGAPGPSWLPRSAWIVAAFGVFGAVRGRREPFVRACAIWGALLVVFHSALPYKTPWLMPAMLLPLSVPAGYGFAKMLAAFRHRGVVLAACVAAAAFMLPETYVLAYRDDVAPANPLAYAASSRDADRLENDVRNRLAKLAPGTPVNVFARDYWPLPWTLRQFPAGYDAAPAPKPDGGLVICGPECLGEYADLGPFETYEIRPGVPVFLATGTIGKNTSTP